MSTTTYREIPAHLQARTPFRGNSARGCRYGLHSAPGPGLLNDEERRAYGEAVALADREGLYVVLSYSTPIAWKVGDRPTYVVEQRFSRTTSRQQHLCRTYL
jgi:hypothetical protein